MIKYETKLYTINGEQVGDVLNTSARKLTLPFMRMPTYSFTLPLTHIRVPRLLNEMLICQVRRDGRIVFNGHIISAEENAAQDAQSVAFTAAGPLWVLSRRFIALSTVPVGWADGGDAGAHPGLMAVNALNTVNDDVPSQTRYLSGQFHTGVKLGTQSLTSLPLSSPRRAKYGPVWFKTMAEALAELSAGASTFEWEIAPIEFETPPDQDPDFLSPFPIIAQLNVAETVGVNRPNAIFEYGTTRANVESYTRSVSRENIATYVHVPYPGFPEPLGTKGVIFAQDTAASESYNLLHGLVDNASIADDSLRGALSKAYLNVRKSPREVLSFKPSMNTRPMPFTDYSAGDQVRVRAVIDGDTRFDRLVRIWGITIDIDPNGNEMVDLELIQP